MAAFLHARMARQTLTRRGSRASLAPASTRHPSLISPPRCAKSWRGPRRVRPIEPASAPAFALESAACLLNHGGAKLIHSRGSSLAGWVTAVNSLRDPADYIRRTTPALGDDSGSRSCPAPWPGDMGTVPPSATLFAGSMLAIVRSVRGDAPRHGRDTGASGGLLGGEDATAPIAHPAQVD
jgi:hypothetical protein